MYHKPVFPVFSTCEDPEGNAIDSDLEKYWVAIKRSHTNILKNAEEIAKMDWPLVKYATLLKEGRPAPEIMSTAESEEVDLVVLGSQGLGGVSGWVLGSTSKNVVENCTKPMLVVK